MVALVVFVVLASGTWSPRRRACRSGGSAASPWRRRGRSIVSPLLLAEPSLRLGCGHDWGWTRVATRTSSSGADDRARVPDRHDDDVAAGAGADADRSAATGGGRRLDRQVPRRRADRGHRGAARAHHQRGTVSTGLAGRTTSTGGNGWPSWSTPTRPSRVFMVGGERRPGDPGRRRRGRRRFRHPPEWETAYRERVAGIMTWSVATDAVWSGWANPDVETGTCNARSASGTGWPWRRQRVVRGSPSSTWRRC